MDTLEDLNRKLEGAKDIKSVVKAMKAMAASRITQYEAAVKSLGDYNHTVTLGIKAYLTAEKIQTVIKKPGIKKSNDEVVCAIVFGSDLGLVGQFNDLICKDVQQSLQSVPGKKEIWVIGERVQALLADAGLHITKSYAVPGSIDAVTPLIQNILIDIENTLETGRVKQFYMFHNQPKVGYGYEVVMQRLLPLDEQWMQEIINMKWPTNNIPEVAGNAETTLTALINAYLFVSVFKACAESLATENASRLEAMQRAEKSIGDMLDSLGKKFQSLRQSMIDEELFDVVSGFEALKK
ncbi:ATP synthase gamma chain [Arcticibacter svalbardensis MN12-7]|uniref:ATP synthase gamma chain n=1 Tax=Arcticibacter svalbardensis MN12-7 TaxID=1150600 RepID=R9GYF5_9SPHI|nr:F0F1 ATP synthase subunit gamma [Arcticibacter svalbardensis]EOR96663.1 ATP synthase gamma chain [Arcticibacter svalbardensis MN12-7]